MMLALVSANQAVVAQQVTLTVVVKGVKDAQGKVSVALYGTEKDFMKNLLAGKTTVAKEGDVQVVFENIPQGSYAVSVMHDENQNDKLDTNMIGIPKEGYGFSNDAVGSFGPPSFEKARFALKGSQTIVVTIRY